MLNIAPITDDQDTCGLRKLHDTFEAHHRGLQAIGVESSAYDAIVVPSIVEKLLEGVRLSITRGKCHMEWSMDELLAEFLEELEIRQEYSFLPNKDSKKNHREDEGNKRQETPSTGSALLAGAEINHCACCAGKHAHSDCPKVKSLKERKRLHRKYGRCFTCLKKGHAARNCNSKINCYVCKDYTSHINL